MNTKSSSTENSPRDEIRVLEKLAVAADLDAMLRQIGAIHARWDRFSPEEQARVAKLEAIFLTLLNARAGKSA